MKSKVKSMVAKLLFAGIIVAIIILAVYYTNNSNKENYRKCVCNEDDEGRGRVCQDVVAVNNAYVSNILTEFSALPSKNWTTVSPGDVKWPTSSGCPWPDAVSKDKWKSWDYTDFGN
jgi:hypothetical protein